MLTKEECIKRLKEAKYTIQPYRYVNEALDFAIKELSNEHFEAVGLLKKHDLENVEKPSLLINEEFVESKEMVDHPSHYNQGKREVIEEMRILFGDDSVESFCRLNAYKYMRRAEFKGNKKEDLDKADWYMDYLEMMRGER